MVILFIGDIVGRIGRGIVSDLLPSFKAQTKADFVIANGENATHGKGLALKHYKEFKAEGIDCVTMGNHFFGIDEILKKNDQYADMVRPYNMNRAIPGSGTKLFLVNGVKIRVTNLMGRVFIEGADANPFDCLEDIISKEEKADIHIVDFHAEATGEKMTLAQAFDGQVSAVIGTHTHVQTNDARILAKGTGFLSDAGMCGSYDSILGVDKAAVIERTRKGIPGRFVVPDDGLAIMSGAILTINSHSGVCEKVETFNLFKDEHVGKEEKSEEAKE
jgi:2',3'-cyclic-nucleotide 2'-phosphodiesterase